MSDERSGTDIVRLPAHESRTESRLYTKDDKALIKAAGYVREKADWGHTLLALAQTKAAHKVDGTGVKVAVLDTGADANHEDLKVTLGKDFTNSRSGWNDVHGHGTHCCGIIAATDNEVGCVGVAPGVTLLAGKVLGDDGSGSYNGIAAGVAWAVSEGADIISMSLGGDGNIAPVLRAAIDAAISAGVIVIVAAGNSGPYNNTVGSPGNYKPCVTVAAVDKYRRIARFSSRGVQVDVCAPGVNVFSTYSGNRYAALSGTSMATPYVAGIAALFVQKCKDQLPGVTVTQALFESYVRKTSRDLGSRGFDTAYGQGLVQPYNMLTILERENPPPPPPRSAQVTYADGTVVVLENVIDIKFV